MVKDQMKDLLTAFTPNGDHLAILSSNGIAKIWSTSDGSLLAEWKQPDGDSAAGGSFSCMACSFVGKKRRKERGTCLLALGIDNGDVLAIDVFSGETKWKTTGSFPGGVAGLSFANKGGSLHVVGINGMASVMNSETGALTGEFKVSKKQISAVAFSSDEKFLAVADGGRLRVLSLENGQEMLKLSNELGHVQYASISDNANALVTSGSGDKHLQVWWLDKNAVTMSRGPILSMKHAPLSFQCRDGCNEEFGAVVLAVSKSGVTYVWHLKSAQLEEGANPTKITCKVNEDETSLQNSGNVKKCRVSIIASRLQDDDATKQTKALVTYGSIDHPHFSLVDITNPGEDVIIDASEETKITQDDGVAGKDLHDMEFGATISPKKSKKASKKRAASDPDHPTSGDVVDIGNGEAVDGILADDDLNEPTMGEKLTTLDLVDGDVAKKNENDESSLAAKPPSADSVQVLLKQALHADDRALLLDCLYTQDEKVIAKSISLLNPSDVLKLLRSLISIIQSRGAILACALPWLRGLLLQHASGIMSQESSLVALNSLYQLIESRVCNFQSTLQLSSVLDVLFAGIVDDEADESDVILPVIFEDKDDSDEEESEDAMETDEKSEDGEESEDEEAADEAFGGLSDLKGDEDEMSE